jgi:RNA polymerase sigma-70 factor (ECF subfamily)
MTDAPSSDAELRRLMRAGLDGDAEAHRLLLTRVSGRLRAYFRSRLTRLGHGPVEAEDLVQEALIAVHTRRHTYDAAQLFTPWLYGIARYKFLDYLRRTRASMRDVPMDEADEVMAHNEAESIESTLDVERMLADLPRKMRQAIQYVKLDGLSVRDAASRSGMSPSAVKVSVHRGLKRLARRIAKESER